MYKHTTWYLTPRTNDINVLHGTWQHGMLQHVVKLHGFCAMLYDSCIINAKSNPKYIRTITHEVILCNTNISSDAPLYCFVLFCPVLGIWTLEVAMDTPLCIGTIYIYTTMYKHYIHVHRAYMHLCVNHSMVCPRDFEVACAFTRFFQGGGRGRVTLVSIPLWS